MDPQQDSSEENDEIRLESWCKRKRSTMMRRRHNDQLQTEEDYLASVCLYMLSRDKSHVTSVNKEWRTKEEHEDFSYHVAPIPKRQQQAVAAPHKCNKCNKSFSSHQALGGHMASHHRKITTGLGSGDILHSSVPTSVPSATVIPKVSFSKEQKAHRCSVCSKVFPSGQALGGHKRRHYDGGVSTSRVTGDSGHNNNKSMGVVFDIDLNIPPIQDAAVSYVVTTATTEGVIAMKKPRGLLIIPA
ncbi:hypothetical protein ZOSMA_52G00860 [Zostera marina]|uniref:C2H2-type domain-containing protein n=1 Tax=Zostera marina TaxID=29655 RepID=A0A0K9NXC6_ZOSMR|nr:hypothetical protein ZOSMA_52G00860 [Zostera marina]